MPVTVRDIVMNAGAFRRAYPNWPSPEPLSPRRRDVPSAKPDCMCGEPAADHWLTLNGRQECTLPGLGCACTTYRPATPSSPLAGLRAELIAMGTSADSPLVLDAESERLAREERQD